MKNELEEKLIKDFPNLYKNFSYIAVGDGWEPLIRELSEKLEPHAKIWWETEAPESDPNEKRTRWLPSYVAQIKEKFGGLRFYLNVAGQEVHDMIAETEAKSFKTCEVCGQSGERRTEHWIKTLCQTHHDERCKNNGA